LGETSEAALPVKEALYVTDAQNKRFKKRIKMIVPVPVPGPALSMFCAQIPAELIRSDIEVDFVGTRNGAHILDSLYEATLADAFCLDMGARAATEGYAAVCINSMSDSGVSALRSRLSIPVVGPGQALFLLATALGKRFFCHYDVATLGLDLRKACTRDRTPTCACVDPKYRYAT
jgi:Asp/Glu/hydantoin racemase